MKKEMVDFGQTSCPDHIKIFTKKRKEGTKTKKKLWEIRILETISLNWNKKVSKPFFELMNVLHKNRLKIWQFIKVIIGNYKNYDYKAKKIKNEIL